MFKMQALLNCTHFIAQFIYFK